jgi:hypothetical protein
VTYPEGEPGVIDLGHRHFVAPLSVPARLWEGTEVTDCWPEHPTGYRWWHDCRWRVERGLHTSWGWFGETPNGRSGHVITSTEPLTVEGSLLCPDCGDHGFIRAGQWVPA